MLKLEQIQLLPNTLMIEEHPVIVQDTVNGIARDPNEVKREREMRLYRTGVIISQGDIDEAVETNLTTKDLVGKTIIYTANVVDVIDLPIEGTKRVVSIHANNIYAFLVDEEIDRPHNSIGI